MQVNCFYQESYLENHNNIVESESIIKLDWKSDTQIDIVWPNQTVESLTLTQNTLFPQANCLFKGRVTGSSVKATIVGCKDSEETIVNLSNGKGVWELILLKDGRTLQQITQEQHENRQNGKHYTQQ